MPLRLAMVSTYPPRRCGLASFAAGLRRGLLVTGAAGVDVVAIVRDSGEDDRVLPRDNGVIACIRQDDPADYLRAAELLNRCADLVLLQHEYGIFGGADGDLVLPLIEALRVPVIATLHTVLSDPSPRQRAILTSVARASAALVVMSRAATRRLVSLYGVHPGRLNRIPHGVPQPPGGTSQVWKERLGLRGTIATTFGLLGPGKGIERTLRALALAGDDAGDLRYLVVGTTHPEVRRWYGEAYRASLESLVAELRLGDRVQFVNRYLDEEELLGYLAATDIYVTPYVAREQVVSGTLTYALALGKAVISTPFAYAEELLADGAGLIVPFGDERALAGALVALARDPERRRLLGERARARTRRFGWADVGRAYLRLARRIAASGGRAVPPTALPGAERPRAGAPLLRQRGWRR